MERKPKFCSCRLAVHHESGRVQWCVGQQGDWQQKLKRLVFLPAILLPLVIVIIFITKYADAEDLSTEKAPISNPPKGQVDLFLVEENLQDHLYDTLETKFLREMEYGLDYYKFGKGFNAPIKDRRIKRNVDKNLLESLRNAAGTKKSSDSTERSQVFWKNEMNEAEIRKLQSNIMKRYMDKSVNPCDDFYKYACGNWKNYYSIPPERNSYDTFEILRENLDNVLGELLLENDSKGEPGMLKVYDHQPFEKGYLLNNTIDSYQNSSMDATTKAKYFFHSCMNQNKVRERGNSPLLKLLEELGDWPILKKEWKESEFDIVWLMAQLRLFNNDILISEWVGPDLKNSEEYIIHLDQTTLGLPSRDYFTNPRHYKYIEAYRTFIVTVALLLGAPEDTVHQDTDDIIKFETKIAEIMTSHEDRKHLERIYLRTTIGALAHFFPQLDWIRYFSMVLGKVMSLDDPVACFCTAYLHRLVDLLSNTNSRVVANYLLWRFIRHRTNNLDERFLLAKQRFYYILFGKEKPPTRWQFCIQQTNANMGMALGKLFVEKYFDEQSRKDTLEMTIQLQQAFQDILSENTWIDSSTKDYALMKLKNIDLKIGYPDFITSMAELNRRYIDVEIHPDYFFENTLSILRHLTRYEQRKVGKEANRTLWGTSPAIVNAYYSRNKNQIMFPAGILQPPFYHKHFPKALNFGGIGVVIGHEITHGFDDKGRLFDQHGNLDYWWKEPSVLEFHTRAQCIIDQYGAYMLPEVNARVNGYLTQGENIADNGGLKQSFRAYQKWRKKHPEAEEFLPGLNLTGEQLFFLNFAQIWCGIQRPESAKTRLQTAVHSPGIFRVLGTLSNSIDFAREYKCPPDSSMNPSFKCVLW
ncbi:neprilysin-4 [Coccinella septempunctata]|uniref:neprilysin-4 n=1 Tax=Coccinella septempunctata TaxID=41139 RepID=UPI001D0911C6|nr:neprilysin-4 [Coccinella septempunctata]XP_044765943.1 neprilysin-4 [Coccinella septempunctata]